MILRRPILVTAPLLLAAAPWACTAQTSDDFENPPPGPPASCAAAPSVTGCEGGSVGYTCAGDRPDHGDTNLVCDDGAPGAAGATIYCCAPYGQYWSDCTVDTAVEGCVGESFGFRCSGPESPGEADATLACSAGTKSGGDTLYCCNSLTLPPTCTACVNDDGSACAGCDGAAIPYTCAAGTRPSDLDPRLVCTPGPSGLSCCALAAE
jgi:hypothetical protein